MVSVSVKVEGDKTAQHQRALVTFPDVGMTSTMCFDALFKCRDNLFLSRFFCRYAVEPPGYDDTPDAPAPYTLDDLAEATLAALDREGVDTYHGLGMGAGAYVLLLMAKRAPERCRGLVLASACAGKPGWREWAWGKLLRNRVSRNGTASRLAANAFLETHYSRDFYEFHTEFADMYATSLATLRTDAVVAYLDAWNARADILEPLRSTLAEVELLMFCGDQNHDYVNHTIRLNGVVAAGKASWVKLPNTGNALFEESPQMVSQAIMYWLAGQGVLLHELRSMNEEKK
eukprot:PhM_4_TR7146/c0_g1_i1/m.83037